MIVRGGFCRPVAAMVVAVAATLPLMSAQADSRVAPLPQGQELPTLRAQSHPVRSGTAFFVSADGKVLTSAHVVAACADITLWPSGAPARQAKVLAVDADADLAVLESPGQVAAIAEIDGSGSVSAGTALMTVGFGTHRHDPLVPEVTRGNMIEETRLGSGRHALVIAASLSPGNSGGPLIDSVGAVRGIVIGRYTARPEHAVAIAADELAPLLARAGIVAPYDAAAAPAVPETDRRAQLLAMSALVQCKPGAVPRHP